MRISVRIKRLALRLRQSGWVKKTQGTEIIEFAVSLPILVVLVVAIYDFGSAFTLKNKLNNAVQEGARIAASQHHPPLPSADDGCGAPASICMVRDIVSTNLRTSSGDDCALGSSNAAYEGTGTFTWTFTGGCSGLSLEIKRGFRNPNTGTLPSPFDDQAYVVENSKVTLVYPYQWQFNKAFQFLAGNANYLSSTITVSATMQNLD